MECYTCRTMEHPLTVALLVNLGIPAAYLTVDYICFAHGLDARAVIMKSGPDLSLIGLGSLGGIFTDDKVGTAMGLPSAVVIVIVVAIILALRGVCYRIDAKAKRNPQAQVDWVKPFLSLFCGISCIAVVSGVLVNSYLH